MTDRALTGSDGTWLGAAARRRHGLVTAFDDERGLGTVTDEEGRVLPFHCTAIADGSRFIEVGTAVVYDVAPGHLGRVEARCLQPVA